jgi:hypothetical protein
VNYSKETGGQTTPNDFSRETNIHNVDVFDNIFVNKT